MFLSPGWRSRRTAVMDREEEEEEERALHWSPHSTLLPLLSQRSLSLCSPEPPPGQSTLNTPYSWKLSWVKTFVNFVVLPPSAKVLSAIICVIRLSPQSQLAIRESFLCEMLCTCIFSPIHESCHPQKFPTTCIYMYVHVCHNGTSDGVLRTLYSTESLCRHVCSETM